MGKLINKISTPAHILAAFSVIREKYCPPELPFSRGFVPGIDGMDLKMFERHLEENIEACRKLLVSGHAFLPQLKREVPKDEQGQTREIYLQSLRDKVAQKAIAMPLARLLERRYSPHLYSYREGRSYSNKEAARRIRALLKRSPARLHIFRSDIPDYTDHLDHARLIALFHEVLPNDEEVVDLLTRFLRQPCYADSIVAARHKGIPTGSPLTPLCANLYLSDVDFAISHMGVEYFRYGDDILILAASEAKLEAACTRLEEMIVERGLTLSPEKTKRHAPGEAFEYLGYRFDEGVTSIARKSLDKYRRWIRKELPRQRYRRFPHRTEEERRGLLRRIILDLNVHTEESMRQLPWIRSFPVLDDDANLRALDAFIKDRIRLCILGKPSSRMRRLIPEEWFRELGYKSLVGAFHRITRRRPLGPYHGWRRFYGTDFEEHLDEHPPRGWFTKRWEHFRFIWRFVGKALRAGTVADRARSVPSDTDASPAPPSGRSEAS